MFGFLFFGKLLLLWQFNFVILICIGNKFLLEQNFEMYVGMFFIVNYWWQIRYNYFVVYFYLYIKLIKEWY